MRWGLVCKSWYFEGGGEDAYRRKMPREDSLSYEVSEQRRMEETTSVSKIAVGAGRWQLIWLVYE